MIPLFSFPNSHVTHHTTRQPRDTSHNLNPADDNSHVSPDLHPQSFQPALLTVPRIEPNMSACSDFAEHVWKPGSCKNCFHPFSAHRRPTARGPAGALPVVCLTRTSLGGGDEEPGVTSPSPYSKPTIAVKPTMMMNSNDANEALTDVNMNGGQVRTCRGWFLSFSLITVKLFHWLFELETNSKPPTRNRDLEKNPRVECPIGDIGEMGFILWTFFI